MRIQYKSKLDLIKSNSFTFCGLSLERWSVSVRPKVSSIKTLTNRKLFPFWKHFYKKPQKKTSNINVFRLCCTQRVENN
jgi:hypothetical protein